MGKTHDAIRCNTRNEVVSFGDYYAFGISESICFFSSLHQHDKAQKQLGSIFLPYFSPSHSLLPFPIYWVNQKSIWFLSKNKRQVFHFH